MEIKPGQEFSWDDREICDEALALQAAGVSFEYFCDGEWKSGHLRFSTSFRYRRKPDPEPAKLQFCDYRGQLVDAPDDFPQTIATYSDGLVIWSADAKLHQVRYGLQVKRFDNPADAMDNFSECICHDLQCQGQL